MLALLGMLELNHLPLVGILDRREPVVVKGDAGPGQLIIGSIGIHCIQERNVLLSGDFVLTDLEGVGHRPQLLIVANGGRLVCGAAAAAGVFGGHAALARILKALHADRGIAGFANPCEPQSDVVLLAHEGFILNIDTLTRALRMCSLSHDGTPLSWFADGLDRHFALSIQPG